MRFLSICCTLLITMCVIMQHQSVEAKPFIFKFFLPQAPAPARDASSSSSTSTGIQFQDILSTKLGLLTSLLQSGTSANGGFSFGFKKFATGTSVTTTRRPNTSTTNTTPDAVFEPESTTRSSANGGSKISTTTEKISLDKTTEKSGSDILSESINDKTSTEKNNYDYSTSKVTTDNSDSEYSISKVTTYKPDGNIHTTLKPGYNYQLPDTSMIENEISNEVIMISNQYLPAL